MKTVVCIFAHPDDEAFGPGGTIAKLARKNRVYIISATKGEAGKEKGRRGSKNLHKIRADELLASAKILGVQKVFFLGFKDGELSNNLYHKLARRLERILVRLKPHALLTYEPRGISGHLDHVAVSMVVSYVFERLPFVKKLMQLCIPENRARMMHKRYFIHFPPGYKKSEIDLVVNVRDTWDTKVRAMLQHQSQIHDIRRILKMIAKFPKKEYFLTQFK
ncbi:MAG: PIG-L family deacetylase [Candidatus Sungbacteria bacterium]|uniref:PIG-L family deacetylase n=1 Tax=Candidatus Sungiibacteriota bacterium TaxID=2750080 RepID=A0A931SC43_9BACT|nr:PIG-L family deacetylase [Candidatus Sungbacteria bacterium]